MPLEKSLAAKLEAWREKNRGKKLVFGTASDREDKHFYRHCQRAAERAGLDPKKFWLHKFRSTFCTWALQRGVDIRKVQHWAGHSSIMMTERYLSPGQGITGAAGDQCCVFVFTKSAPSSRRGGDPMNFRRMLTSIEAVVNRYYPKQNAEPTISTPHQEGEGTVQEFAWEDLSECWEKEDEVEQ